jgi:AcrR family transcriptional regulator
MIARADTKTKILNAAEKLFGEKGFDATSLRDITARAEVNLAAVNYHFQSKDSLIDSVIQRRLAPINRRRLEMLDAAGPDPSIEAIVEAFVLPVLEQDTSIMVTLMGRVFATPDMFLVRVFKKHLAPVAQRFGEACAKAAPDLSPGERMWRLMFMAGTMSHILLWSHVLPEMTSGVCDPSDSKAVTARIVRFVSAGFRAPEAPNHA